MGVIKNLMVRIGADVREFRRGMKDASGVTVSTSQTVSKQMSNMKKNVADKLSSSRLSIREYTAAISQTKEKYTVATQNVERLSDKLQQLQGVYDTVKNATQGIDLSKPLEELIVDAEKALTQIEAKRKKIEAELQGITNSPRGSSSKKTAALQAELETLSQKSQFVVARLENLNQVADAVGASNMGYASAAGLQKLEGQISATKNELNTTKLRAEELGSKLKSFGILPTVGRAIRSIGTAAVQAAKGGVSQLWQKLKSFGGTVLKGIASIPSKLKSIGSSADRSCGGLGRMVRSIRNIGIASLGMRIAGGMFGRLRSIISSYISQNEELNASVESMKNQMGQALLPAINLVLAAMQQLMPVVTAVSNGINAVLTSLFGKMGKTTAGIKKAADAANSLNVYGFDQITKASDTSSDSSASTTATESKQSALVQKLTGWIQRMKAAFVAGDWRKLGQIVGDGINSVFDSINGNKVGAKIGTFINNVFTTAHGLLTTVNFGQIGTTLGNMFTSAIEQVDWKQAGNVIGRAILVLPTVLVNFVLGTDWKKVGQAVSDCIKSVFSTFTEWIHNTDWLQIGKSAADLIGAIDWGGIVSNMFSLLGAALGAGVSLLWGAIGGAVTSIKNYFSAKIEEAGGNVGKGLLNGVLSGLGNIGAWLSTNVVKPFVAGFSGLGNGVVELMENMINSIIKGLNKLFSGLNKFLSIGEKVGINLSIPTLKEVKLPRAAKGTIVSKATDLTVGEDGTEAVMPLERHTEWLDVMASKLSAKMSGGGTGPTSLVLQFILGNRKLTEYYIKDINQIAKETGVCPIKI